MATFSVEDVAKMKVADLKKELKDRGLRLTGTKAELADRLRAFLSTDGVTTGSDLEASTEQAVESDPAGGKTIKVGAVPSEQTAKTVSNSTEGDNSKNMVSIRGLSEAERLKARAEKFGGSLSDDAKKQMRAARFGLSSSSVKPSSTTDLGKISATPASGEDMDKMKKRAERFGSVTSGKLSKIEEEEKRKKRLERFGAGMVSAPSEAKKVKLAAMTSVDVEQQKRKRAERFGLT